MERKTEKTRKFKHYQQVYGDFGSEASGQGSVCDDQHRSGIHLADTGFSRICEMEPEILECHYITGEYDYMLKVTTTNTHTLEMIMNRIKGFHGIKRTQTNVILSTTKQLHSVSPVL